MRPHTVVSWLVIAALASACSKVEKSTMPVPESEKAPATAPPPKSETAAPPAKSESAPKPVPGAEPDHIKVQHVLIGFKDAVGFIRRGPPPPGAMKRTKDEAEKLANEIFARAKKGEDFDKLVKDYTDDSAPGFYTLANRGKPLKPGWFAREGMVPAFGDVGFPLQVGEIGMSTYDETKSPYGWHIVKRIE